MSSTKCRACGLTNFSSAVRCRQCGFSLFGVAAGSPAGRRKPSRRWMLNATIVSIVLAVVLLFGIYFFTLLITFEDPGQLRGGWVHFTPEQLRTMGSRYGLALIIGLAIVWGFFYARRDKYDL
ncbi:MAG TPA: hypothetical protein VGC87_16760 [Pyrinomonadaceae bacterium]|jgi:hypothetical protein